MNIGIDIRGLTMTNPTGVGNYIWYALENILRQDQNNYYYLFNAGLKNKLFIPSLSHFPHAQIVHLDWPNKALNLGLALQIGPDIFKKIGPPLDIFWLPNINFYKFNPAVPTVLTVHDLSWLHRPAFYSLKRKWWHQIINVRRLINSADKIIAVSENTKRDIVRFFNIDSDKITVIYPGVNQRGMNEAKARYLITHLALPDKYFIYVGTLEPRKNIESVILAFDKYHRLYPETALVIVGAKGWLYRQLIKSFKQRDYVRYLGYVDHHTKDALYFLSQGLIWPSFYEGFGLPPLEALAHQIPVIASYKASLPEILKNQALYVDPYNISDIVQTLISLTEDSALRDQLKYSAADFVIPDWPTQAIKIIKLFSNIKK